MCTSHLRDPPEPLSCTWMNSSASLPAGLDGTRGRAGQQLFHEVGQSGTSTGLSRDTLCAAEGCRPGKSVLGLPQPARSAKRMAMTSQLPAVHMILRDSACALSEQLVLTSADAEAPYIGAVGWMHVASDPHHPPKSGCSEKQQACWQKKVSKVRF